MKLALPLLTKPSDEPIRAGAAKKNKVHTTTGFVQKVSR